MPDEVFRQWQERARERRYEKMFVYESFDFENIKYCYNRTRPRTAWEKASDKEQKEFTRLYRTVLMRLLTEKNDDSYESLLRLKEVFQIRVTRYTVNLTQSTAELWVAGEYPGEEKIRMTRKNGSWYLINPFGYHSYVPVLKALLKKNK